jgi:hypothetical protein
MSDPRLQQGIQDVTDKVFSWPELLLIIHDFLESSAPNQGNPPQSEIIPVRKSKPC